MRRIDEVAVEALVETGFLLALNPKDSHHNWALGVLGEAKAGRMILYISPIAPVELSLMMRVKGYGNDDVRRVLEALNSAIMMYTRPRYPQSGLRHVAYAAELMGRYPELTFFDSIHASITIDNGLTYYDLDEVIRRVIIKELEKG